MEQIINPVKSALKVRVIMWKIIFNLHVHGAFRYRPGTSGSAFVVTLSCASLGV
jgi:hypothetical protein